MLHQHPGGIALTKRVIDYCAFFPGAKVIDVGCGTGVTVEYLCDTAGLQAVGVDLSRARLEQGKKRSPGLPVLQAAGEDLPFADACFEGGIAECSLSVMQDPAKVLAEFSRVLVLGGKLAITDIYVPDSENTSGFFYRRQLQKMLAEAGFTVITWEDQSACLREFVASYIMADGDRQELWQCVSAGTKAGYFLLVAEKLQREG